MRLLFIDSLTLQEILTDHGIATASWVQNTCRSFTFRFHANPRSEYTIPGKLLDSLPFTMLVKHQTSKAHVRPQVQCQWFCETLRSVVGRVRGQHTGVGVAISGIFAHGQYIPCSFHLSDMDCLRMRSSIFRNIGLVRVRQESEVMSGMYFFRLRR